MANSTKKKNRRFSRISGWLKPSSASKTMVLFVMVFGILAGGYMMKSSFAASCSDSSQDVSISYNTINHYACKGHCHVQYGGGDYLGLSYTKARVYSSVAGRTCKLKLEVYSRNGYYGKYTSPIVGNTAYNNTWYQVTTPIGTLSTGIITSYVTIYNIQNGTNNQIHIGYIP
ncbi:MAG: hypothetical protein ACXWLH_05055 [Candidatus Saccharimonadales bacterium]